MRPSLLSLRPVEASEKNASICIFHRSMYLFVYFNAVLALMSSLMLKVPNYKASEG